MKKIRAIYRLLLFAVATTLKISQISLYGLLLGADARRNVEMRGRYLHWLLRQLGVRLHVQGEIPDYPCLMMGNHRSYLDPLLVIRDVAGFPVSKSEVAHWPLVGWAAAVTGVLFLKRDSAGSRKATLAGIADKIKAGFPVLLFPEGTTHAEPQTRPLRSGGFKLAASEGFTVVPVMVEYREKADYWINDDTFLSHFIRRFGERRMEVWVHYGQALQSRDAEALMEACKKQLDAELLKVQKSF
jgi:lyso-ornithine lipid O-acyltransferase